LRQLPNNPYGWGCGGSLAVLAVLTLLENTPLGLRGNQPGVLFVLLGVGFVGGFAIAARIQWRNQDAPAGRDRDTIEVDPLFAGVTKGLVTVDLPEEDVSQAPSRPIVDTVGCLGSGGGAAVGFIVIFVLALNGIVKDDLWIVIGTLGGGIIGGGVAAFVLWRMRSPGNTQ
jgi:hypothetical protein